MRSRTRKIIVTSKECLQKAVAIADCIRIITCHLVQ